MKYGIHPRNEDEQCLKSPCNILLILFLALEGNLGFWTADSLRILADDHLIENIGFGNLSMLQYFVVKELRSLVFSLFAVKMGHNQQT